MAKTTITERTIKMITITRYSKPASRSRQATSKSSKFTQRKAAPNSVRLAEEVKAYRKAKLAFRVYASMGDFANALKELMKLNEITRFSQHPAITGHGPESFCFSKYPGRWTQGMLKLIPAEELIDFRLKHNSEICFGNLEVIDSHLKQRRHKVVYNLIASEKLKVTRRELSSYIHECLAQQSYSYHLCLFSDWGIQVNWVEQKLIRYGEAIGKAEAAGEAADAN
jgi:hypothetical protein